MMTIRLILILLFLPLTIWGNSPLTLDQKIGQLIIVGFRGYEIPDDHWIAKQIENGTVGGVILYDFDTPTQKFERNIRSPEQVKALTRSLQSKASIPLLIAIDQEGGVINHLHHRNGFPVFVSQLSLGNKNNLQGTYNQGETIGKTLKEAGINLNFAPVIDLDANILGPIHKKERSFSADPEIVIAHAREIIKGHHKHGIFTTLKHFPGLGSGGGDTHLGFVDLTPTWTDKELIPFRALIASNEADMIMITHGFNEKFDSQKPFSLSRVIITDLLRTQLNYKGVIITDDLQMKAISKFYSLEETVKLALQAGTDILLFSNQMEYDPDVAPKIVAIVKNLIQSGQLTEKQINDSFDRIQNLKQSLK